MLRKHPQPQHIQKNLSAPHGGFSTLGVPYWGPYYKGIHYMGVYIRGPFYRKPHMSLTPLISQVAKRKTLVNMCQRPPKQQKLPLPMHIHRVHHYPKPYTLNPKPSTLNPKTPKPETLNPKQLPSAGSVAVAADQAKPRGIHIFGVALDTPRQGTRGTLIRDLRGYLRG